jgi:two-component system, chemotaxis family, protein-glutamate methylesterase/glutaminase
MASKVLSLGKTVSGSLEIMNIVVIAASAGGFTPLRHIIASLPVPCWAAVLVVMHIGSHPSTLPQLLQSHGQHPAVFPPDNTLIEAGYIYVAPPDLHMLIKGASIRLSAGPKVHHTRPAADPLFFSAAKAYGPRVMGVVLSGGDGDGADGLRVIRASGGTAYVQNPEEAEVPSMPMAAIMAAHPDACLPTRELAQLIRSFCLIEPRDEPD